MTDLLKIILAVCLLTPATFAQSDADTHVDVTLTWQFDSIAPGEQAMLGVIMKADDGWHIQAGKGSGDHREPYIPTTINLTLPDGFTAGEIIWPEAHRFTLGPKGATEQLKGYDGETLAAVPITVPAETRPGEYPVVVEFGYQACDDMICLMPTSTTVQTTLTVSETSDALRTPTEDFAAFAENLPGFLDSDETTAERDSQDFLGNQSERLDLELIWYEGELKPGRQGSLGVVLDIQDHWHIQAGEGSGDEQADLIATTIDVSLPSGWTISEIMWPETTAFTVGQGEGAISGEGYAGRTLAIVPVDLPDDVSPGEYPVEVTVGYQACDDEVCEMPTTAVANGMVTVIGKDESAAATTFDDETAGLFEDVFSRDQTAGGGSWELPDLSNTRWWLTLVFVLLAMFWMTVRTFALTDRIWPWLIVAFVAVLVSLGYYSFVRGATADFPWVHYTEAKFQEVREDGRVAFIKFTADWCVNCQVNERIILGSDEAVAELSRPNVVPLKVDFTGPDPEGSARQKAVGGGGIPLIAVYHPGREEPIVLHGQLLSAEPVIRALQGRGVTTAEDEVLFTFLNWQFGVGDGAIVLIMGLAFLAGFFMNFTPCVLPVVPLKILSLQGHSKNPRRCFLLGLVFGVGIVALYAFLGVLIAGLVGGVERLDWGEQFQLWWLNALLGGFVLAMGVAMLGMFTIRLPQFLYMFNPQSDTVSGSFFMGVFTAVLATPCTGPLLGATVAWSATQPPSIAFLALVIMGLGMAFPYVLLTAKPSWLEKMPRTGPGSELVKQVMGLLLLAVAAYFLCTAVNSYQSSGDETQTYTMVATSEQNVSGPEVSGRPISIHSTPR